MREIEKAKDITRKETGAFKYDFVYDECIKIIDKKLTKIFNEIIGEKKEYNPSVVSVNGSDDLTDGYNLKREEIIKLVKKYKV